MTEERHHDSQLPYLHPNIIVPNMNGAIFHCETDQNRIMVQTSQILRIHNFKIEWVEKLLKLVFGYLSIFLKFQNCFRAI